MSCGSRHHRVQLKATKKIRTVCRTSRTVNKGRPKNVRRRHSPIFKLPSHTGYLKSRIYFLAQCTFSDIYIAPNRSGENVVQPNLTDCISRWAKCKWETCFVIRSHSALYASERTESSASPYPNGNKCVAKRKSATQTKVYVDGWKKA